jgi:hypothetical protein
MKKSRIRLTMLTIIIRIIIMLIIGRRKIKKLERISRRRNAENLLDLPKDIRFRSDNLIVFVKLIIYFYRFYRLFAAEPRDYIIGINIIYFEISLPIAILIKILILIFQISVQYLISISNYRLLIFLKLIRLDHTLSIFYIFD